MRIGFDIDGCMTDDDEYRLAFMSKYAYENGMDILDDPCGYEHKASFWNREVEREYRQVYHEDYMRNVSPRYHCAEILKKLHDEGHQIILITGRYPGFYDTEEGKKVRSITEEWLKKNEIVYDKLVFTGFPKVEYIRNENVDLMVEDYDGTILDCLRYFPVFCYDNRYNRDLTDERVTRVYSWYDLYRKFHRQFFND